MLIVVAIIAVIAGLSFPALTAGLAGVRLASAAGSAASFLTSAMNNVERRERPAEIVISPKENRIAVFTAAAGDRPVDTLTMPAGVTVEGEEPHRFLLFPGGAFPRISLVLKSEKGGRRSIEIDPITAVPKISRLAADGK
jgi:hypothetical protein